MNTVPRQADPRQVGWFDAVATRYGCEIQGATEVALTNLDVLGYLDEIPVCVAYEYEGKRVDRFPVTPMLEKVYAGIRSAAWLEIGCPGSDPV